MLRSAGGLIEGLVGKAGGGDRFLQVQIELLIDQIKCFLLFGYQCVFPPLSKRSSKTGLPSESGVITTVAS